MPSIPFTAAQRQAIEATGRSVIVSAAAGSGKTAVLAERCAYLVCDAPQPARCDADELLVLTFTDAAASEMRSRIVEAIRDRAAAEPNNARLGEQATLVGAARITTIHAFCLWLVRRWFSEINVDPSATLLDPNEARLLRREVLDELFRGLYGLAAPRDAAPLGDALDVFDPSEKESPAVTTPSEPPLAARFVRLIDDYGLGEDRAIGTFVLRLSAFLASLPDAEAWCREAVESVERRPEDRVIALIDGVRGELDQQGIHCEEVARRLRSGHPIATFYAELMLDYAHRLREWSTKLSRRDGANELAMFDEVRADIAAFDVSAKGAPRLSKDADPDIRAARDAASDTYKWVRKNLLIERLQKRYAHLTVDQWIQGLQQTAPYLRTLVELVEAFDHALTARKRELNVLEFSDLERLAHQLLHDPTHPDRPSSAARSLHRRFAHVLVDEFQDVNPIQQDVLRLVSRESDPESDDNLFVVGDVKQSIYRFRLAEPGLFASRLARFLAGDQRGEAVALQENFRSRAEILDAVNLLFRSLMRRGSGEVQYDDRAELRPGRASEGDAVRSPVALHLLERSIGQTAASTARDARSADALSSDPEDADTEHDAGAGSALTERVTTDLNDSSKWDPIEREAFLIGTTILAWRSSGAPIVDGRPPEFRDVAILLRVARMNADRVTAILGAMGVPAFAAVGGSLFGTLEIRDVTAALELLDNPQQDIPLAAVMRSGVLGVRFNEDDLLTIRCHARDTSFHHAVRVYGAGGASAELRERLERLKTRIEHLRDAVRRRPLSDVLRRLYDERGYMAYVCGLPAGQRRRANLLKLHEVARSFGSFRKQGLHRFLRFIDSLEQEDQVIAPAPAIGESENVVRVMSIHQAKGLEFPVVFVAGLGTKFNLGDRSGRMIFERRAHIGLRAVDPQRLIEYPTATHRLAVAEVERTARAEEMRILYVAMTRARDRLVLVGTEHDPGRRLREADGAAPSSLSLQMAQRPLDWIVPILGAAPAGTVDGIADRGTRHPEGASCTYRVVVHDAEEIGSWRVRSDESPDQSDILRAAASQAPLPKDEPIAADDAELEQVRRRIEYVYPFLPVTAVPATMAAGTFKGTFDGRRIENDIPRNERADPSFVVLPSRYGSEATGRAVETGLLMHRVLQHLDFTVAVHQDGVLAALDRLRASGAIDPDERDRVDVNAIIWFVATPLAASIRSAGAEYRREFHFIGREPAATFDADAVGEADDFVLVRGIVDGVWPVEDALEIVDFKTDSVSPDAVAVRAERYRSQMWLYARAVSNLWAKPVCRATLVFLSAQRMVVVDQPGTACVLPSAAN